MFFVKLIHRRYVSTAALKADVSFASELIISSPSSSSTMVLEWLLGDFLVSGHSAPFSNTSQTENAAG